MNSPVTGEPTNMVFGFASMLLKLLKEDAPEYLAVVIDVASDQESFRSELYEEYKANREEAPDDFGPQVDRCVELLETMGIPVLGEPAVEADDVIASLVRRLTREHDDLEIRIVSRDKDLSQLIGDRVELYDPHKSGAVLPSEIFKTEGVRPDQVRDILALMGDTSDNIPGVPGIGPKTAAKLIMEYGSIEGVYDHIDEIKGKRHENLQASREQVALSRKLVTLIEDLDVDLDLADATADSGKWPVGEVVDLFKDLGFNRLQDEIASLGVPPVVQEEAAGLFGGDPGSLFAPMAVQRPPLGTYTCVKDAATLAEIVTRAVATGAVAIDTETTSLRPRQAKLCGVSLAIEPSEAWYIPVRSPEPDSHLGEAEVLEALAPILAAEDITLIGHNIKYDLVVLRSAGATVRGPMVDTMVASFVADGSRSSHAMDALARGLLEIDCIPISDLIGKGATQRTFDAVDLETATTYAAEDADVTLRLHDHLVPIIEQEGLLELFDEVEMPLVPVLADMEYNGIRVDPTELATQEAALQGRLETLRTQIAHASPVPLNPDSPKQLAAVLFGRTDGDPPGLGLKPIKKGKTGPSTDQEVLERLSQDPSVTTDLPELILAYRQLSKLVSTYLISLAEAINPATGCVHCSFHQTVAATGRLSSSDPNLQNIPIRTEVGREIRKAFVAAKGCRLIAADYSQIELRVLAHLSGDPALIAAFNAGSPER
jgi:DNA polymerase-1